MKKGHLLVSTCLACLIFFHGAGYTKGSPVSWQEEVKACAQKKKYVFLFIDDGKTSEGQVAKKVLQETAQDVPEQVSVIEVNYNSEKKSIANFIKPQKLEEVPLTLVIAPNGAITGGFGKKVNKESLKQSLVSPREAELILSLQKNQAVFLCLFETQSNELEKVKSELKTIEQLFRGAATAYYIDINDTQEASLIKKLPVSASITVFTLVPPGRVISKLEGSQINTRNLLQALQSACGSGCSSGCK